MSRESIREALNPLVAAACTKRAEMHAARGMDRWHLQCEKNARHPIRPPHDGLQKGLDE